MATINDILNFAFTHKIFTRKELLANIKSRNPMGSSSSLSEQLNRLLKSGQIIRLERGVYSLPDNIKKDFFINCSDDIRSIDLQIKKQFPFANYCIWDSSAIMSYMLHIPNIKFIYVDVEREVAESAFNLLNSGNTKRVYLMPTLTDFERYISGNEAIIIRPLISESPLQVIEGINTPAIEKILVDIVDDVEFSFLQGSELHYVYNTIFERHNINKNKLLRYATRRGRKQEVEQLLKTNKL
jgi:hypothetical protein